MASTQGGKLLFLDSSGPSPSPLRWLVHMGSGWDPQPSPPVLTSADRAHHHSGCGPNGPCAFPAVPSPDPAHFPAAPLLPAP